MAHRYVMVRHPVGGVGGDYVVYRARGTESATWHGHVTGQRDEVVFAGVAELCEAMRVACALMPEARRFSMVEEFAGHMPSVFWSCVALCNPASSAATTLLHVEQCLFALQKKAAST